MSAPSIANDALAGGKKRKRTGKEREERKRLAILAQQEAEEAEEAEDVAEDPVIAESSSHGVQDTSTATGPEIRGVDVEQATKRIPQALKSLHPTFKQAKTFETRRLIKKIKFLRTKPDTKAEVTDLEGQLKILHDIQLHPLAQSHLLVKLRKYPHFKATSLPKSILDLLTIQETTSTSTSSTAGSVAKVENRLCSSKNVAEAVKGVVSWIVGEEGAKLVHHVKKENKAISAHKGARKIEEESDGAESDEDVIEGGQEMVVGSASENEGEESEDEGLAQQDYAADEAGWESGSIGGEPDESDEEEEEDISDENAIPIPPSKKSKPTPAPQQPKEKPSRAEKLPKGDITSSMFLPSLAAGFTRGDEGDSDPDDDLDPNGVIGKNTKERKNRRGQRARQAIWEKKYGKGAKHVVKAKEDEEAYQAAKAKREADKRGRPDHMKGRDSGWGARSGQPSIPNGSASTPKSTVIPQQHQQAPKEEKKNLHPSWEAARLRKQKMGVVPADAPKANKIVFD
ncbi:hypothetical protein V865_006914 [Kwoniella europaea PYCC6329]|uniref:Bud22 domain-containing protein n=1 Tax=Kwoniella europaea PYCC6329 TaxID=1423913 RepID=A0AAX4KQM4_9TREE